MKDLAWSHEGLGKIRLLKPAVSDTGEITGVVLASTGLFLGTSLLSIITCESDPLILVALLLGIGLVLHLLCAPNGKYARNAFIMTFAVCVFVTALIQGYALLSFGEVQTTPDAIQFWYPNSRGGLSDESLEELRLRANGPLALILFQYLYEGCFALGLGNGPWAGVLLNCFVVGLCAGIISRIGWHLWGDDSYRLKFIGFLCAFCGPFWYYGALFLRDSFCLFLTTVLLWAIVRLLTKRGVLNLIIAAAVLVGVTLLFKWIREGLAFLPALAGVAAIIAYISPRRPVASIVVLIALLSLVVASHEFLTEKYMAGQALIERTADSANDLSRAEANTASLGMELVMSQPTHIRIFAGLAIALVYPIPLWAGFRMMAPEYDLLVSLAGLSVVGMLPYAYVGILRILFSRTNRAKSRIIVGYFLIILMASIPMATALVSMFGGRHIWIFCPALILLCAFPDWHDIINRQKLRLIQAVWFGCLAGLHIFWAAMKLPS